MSLIYPHVPLISELLLHVDKTNFIIITLHNFISI